MARPPQEAIEMFMSITGASESVALQKLEEHGGDLNVAVNAHFNEGDRTMNRLPVPSPLHHDDVGDDDAMDLDDPLAGGIFRNLPDPMNQFSLLDPNFRRNFFNGVGPIPTADSFFRGAGPRVSHPREVRQIPIEVKDGDNTGIGPSSEGPKIEEVSGDRSPHGPETHGTVVINDDDNEDVGGVRRGELTNLPVRPSAPPIVDDVSEYGNVNNINNNNSNDIEEQMIRAAIEASKREAGANLTDRFDVSDDLSGPQFAPTPPPTDDAELARAVSLSIEMAEKERTSREQGMQVDSNLSDTEMENSRRMIDPNGREGLIGTEAETSNKIFDEGNPSFQEESEDIEEQPLVRHRTRRNSTRNSEPIGTGQVEQSPPSSPEPQNVRNGDDFPSEWGGISSEEHDEAVMLEAAMFGGIPEGGAYHFAGYPPRVGASSSDRFSGFYPAPRPPSPTLTAQRLLREQQDDEYLASLQADQEKEMKAMQEEAAAREAALAKQRLEQEENLRKQLEQEEMERKLAAKEASLPQEPSPDDENSVTLLVRMPDGNRLGRRFLRSHKLQFLFDFIDTARVVKPGTYRLVRPYPRRAFTDGESELSLSDLGMTSKQEALFLELV